MRSIYKTMALSINLSKNAFINILKKIHFLHYNLLLA